PALCQQRPQGGVRGRARGDILEDEHPPHRSRRLAASQNLELIPVVDLLHGQVVRGVRGERAAYRPIESALCRSSDPATVARILCDHCAARRLYVADLDALTGRAAQVDLLRTLLAALP